MRKPLKIPNLTDAQNEALTKQLTEWFKDTEEQQRKMVAEGDLTMLTRLPSVDEGGRGRLVVIQSGKDQYLGVKYHSGWEKLYHEATTKTFSATPGVSDGVVGRIQLVQDPGDSKFYAYFKWDSTTWKKTEVT